MKSLNGNKKIAVLAGTADAEIYKDLLNQDHGIKKLLVEPGLSAYLMSDGTTVEVYSAGFAYPDYLFAKGNVVVSYRVDSVEQVANRLESKGAQLLGGIEQVCTSYRYCHLLTKEQTVIGLYEQG